LYSTIEKESGNAEEMEVQEEAKEDLKLAAAQSDFKQEEVTKILVCNITFSMTLTSM